MADRLCVGVVVGAHGVKGQLRIKSFTADPLDLTEYGPLETEAGERWRLQNVAVGVNGVVTAKIDKIGDRNQAEAVKGVKLYVSRDALPPPPQDEFYVADLIGLTAWNIEGTELGVVTAIYDFGAGDLIEVKGKDGELLVPFTLKLVPEVDLKARRVVIDPPLTVEIEEDAPPDDA
jgi:16S rRNA processing protein RimM